MQFKLPSISVISTTLTIKIPVEGIFEPLVVEHLTVLMLRWLV